MATAIEITNQVKQLIDANYSVVSKLMIASYGVKHGYIDKGRYDDYKASLLGVANAQPEATTKAEILTKDFGDKPTIDFFTRLDIFERIIWPNISVFYPQWVDDPKAKDGNMWNSAMKGVLYNEVWSTDHVLKPEVVRALGLQSTDMAISFLDNAGTIQQSIKDQKKLISELATHPDIKAAGAINVRKDVMMSLFSSDAAVKLFFLENYITNKEMGNPFALLGIDPYFAYLLMFTGWGGTLSAFMERKAKITLNGAAGEYSLRQVVMAAAGKNVSSPSWSSFDDTKVWYNVVKDTDGKENSWRANLAVYATRFLEVTGGWLAGVKNDQPDVYQDWNNKFIVDKKCMINMLVIVNELVNLSGTANTFTYQASPLQFQNALGLAYKKFEITVGD